MHSFTPFLALVCQFFECHHVAFFAVDLADGSLWIMFEVTEALAHTAVRLGVVVVECASIWATAVLFKLARRPFRCLVPFPSSDNILPAR